MESQDTIDAINTLYKSLSTSQKAITQSLNLELMKSISDSLVAVSDSQRIYSEALKKIGNSFVQSGLADSIAKLQANIIKNVPAMNVTPLADALKKASIDLNYAPAMTELSKALESTKVLAADLAILRKTNLIESLGTGYTLPKGLKTAIKSINIPTAEMLLEHKEIEFDICTKKFFFEREDGVTEATASELNSICSASNLFNEIKSEDDDDALDEKSLMDFMTYLFEKPTMGMVNSTGKKIYELISSIWLDKEMKNSIGFDEAYYYHSRKHGINVAPYVYSQLLKAPTGVSGPGRYNHAGRGHYYFSNTKYGAENEIKKHSTGDYIIQTIKIAPTKDIRMLDLSGSIVKAKTFLKYLRFPVSEINSQMPREYLIPCFVADCCKEIGFEGIKYKGDNDSFNYVCWNDGYFSFVENA